MAAMQAPELFKLLGHDIRWQIVMLLARSDYYGQELVRKLKQPQNLLSYHLKLLADHQLVHERRNDVDERSIYYSLNIEMLRALYQASGAALHLDTSVRTPIEQKTGEDHVWRVLFLCTHNSARSQMAEAILRQLSQGRIEVYSAGSHPTHVHPLTRKALEQSGFSLRDQHSKSVDEFKGYRFDYVITLCDREREVCPTFPDQPELMHWSLPDPVMAEGSLEECHQAFERVACQLVVRVRYLLILLLEQESLDV